MVNEQKRKQTISLQPGSPPRAMVDVPRFLLRVVSKRGSSQSCEVSEPVLIGRDLDCDMVLEDPSVSGRHARVSLGENGLLVTDLGSTNGTFINDTRVSKGTAVHGDFINIGQSRVKVEWINKPLMLLPDTATRLCGMVGSSEKMRLLFRIIRRIAPTEFTVLITGETGTGKELAAQAVHSLSSRSSGPFVVVDGTALAGDLFADKLFGHASGAFTGAVSNQPGAFELADGGTLFLDEVGELPLSEQARLLRVLESRCVQRIGGKSSVPVNVRVIAATLRDIRGMVEKGQFRRDLYYRLNELNISLPPLRERIEDIPILVQHLSKSLAPKLGSLTPASTFSSTAIKRLSGYSWPGNVRELRNYLVHVVVHCDKDVINAEDLPPFDSVTAQPPDSEQPGVGPCQPPLALRDIEKAAISAALKRSNGNRAQAARELGIAVSTLKDRIKRYGL